MAKTINFGRMPREKDLDWFAKNIGPRTHYTKYNIGGEGWCFTFLPNNPWSNKDWVLTVDDEKYLSFYLLTR